MRTTITMDDELLEAAKRKALDKGSTLSAFIEEAVRAALASSTSRKRKYRFKLVTFGGDGLQPGVDWNNLSALIHEEDVEAFRTAGPR
jgi:Arc/MetJ family transcription regulator